MLLFLACCCGRKFRDGCPERERSYLLPKLDGRFPVLFKIQPVLTLYFMRQREEKPLLFWFIPEVLSTVGTDLDQI